MLVAQRDKWKKEFSEGKVPLFFDEYKHNRNSESWRLSKAFEEVLEYCLYLERSREGE